MPLRNILACLESSPSRIAIKKVVSFSSYWGFKNAISFKISGKNAFFSIFSSLLFVFLIDFSKILQLTFPCSQLSLRNILRNQEHGIDYISQIWWSNFHKISILFVKFHKKSFEDYLFSISCINGGNLKEFKFFDLAPTGWPTIEWPIQK